MTKCEREKILNLMAEFKDRLPELIKKDFPKFSDYMRGVNFVLKNLYGVNMYTSNINGQTSIKVYNQDCVLFRMDIEDPFKQIQEAV